jgi:hypothetical protein
VKSDSPPLPDRPRARTLHSARAFRPRANTTTADESSVVALAKSAAQFANWYEGRRAQRQAEIDALRRQGALARGIAPSELDLFRYLTRRAFNKQIIETENLEPLLRANRTINETRERLSLGRGNVHTDLARTDHRSFRHVKASRDLFTQMKSDYKPGTLEKHEALRAATTMALRAGNCGEYAGLATLISASSLEPGETARKVGTPKRGDHDWSELWMNGTEPADSDIIIDAWANGPPVLREDSKYARRPKPAAHRPKWLARYPQSMRPTLSLDRETGQEANEYRKFFLNLIDETEHYQTFVATKLADYRNVKLAWRKRWAREPVASKAFVKRAQRNMKALERAPHKRLLQQVAEARPAQQPGSNVAQTTQSAEQLKSTIKALKQARNGRLLQQIVAAGTARQLGSNIRQASGAETISSPSRSWRHRLLRPLRYIGSVVARASLNRFAFDAACYPFGRRAARKPPA